MREFLWRRWYRLARTVPADPGPLDPVTFEDPDPFQRQVLATGSALREVLTQNILPFWIRNAVDRDSGGFVLNHDVAGRWKGPADRSCTAQCRTLWFFSRVAREGWSPEAEALARHGFDFISAHFWDEEHAGFVSAVSHNGTEVTDGQKQLYDQTFAVYALSEYFLATGDCAAAELATRGVKTLGDRFEDPVHGGYEMGFERAWTPLVARSTEGKGHPPKRTNETIHVLEALTLYDQVAPGDPWVRDQLHRLVLISTGTVLRKRHAVNTDEHRHDWTPLLGERIGTVSYGHDLETVALVAAGCNQAGIALPLVADWMRAVVDSALRWGADRHSGGMFHSGPLDGPAWDRRKTWWVQAEVLVGALTIYRITGDRRYADLYLRTLDWTLKRHVDREGGDWHAFAHRDGSVSGDKAYAWKGPYHNGRAMMQCLRLLNPGDPLAPGWLVD